MEETIGHNGGIEPGEIDLLNFGVPYSLAILETFGYRSEFLLSLKMFFLFNLRNFFC